MGTFNVKMRLFPCPEWSGCRTPRNSRTRHQSHNGEKPVEVNALVDTGSFWSWVPTSILRKLGVKPIETVRGELADGSICTKKVGEIRVEVNGKCRTTLVIFGDKKSAPILGALTLEELGFDVSSTGKRLKPIKIFPLK